MSTLTSRLRRNPAHVNVVPDVGYAGEVAGGVAAPVAEATVGLAGSAPREGFYVGRELDHYGDVARSERRSRRTAGLFTRSSRNSSPRPSRSPERAELRAEPVDRCEGQDGPRVAKFAASSMREAPASRPATPTAKLGANTTGPAVSPPPSNQASRPIPIGKATQKPSYTGHMFDVPTKLTDPMTFARTARVEWNKRPLANEELTGELEGAVSGSPGTAAQRDWPFVR